MNTPMVSIIVNCYNGEKYLSEALQSVIAQTYLDWELIFWDNKSTDRSKDIFYSFNDQRFRYFEAQEHTTLGMARKLAFEHARGKWVSFLDCDDVLYNDKIGRQLEAINGENQSIGMIYCDTDFVTSDAEVVWREYTTSIFFGFESLPEGNIFSKLCESCFITLVSALVNRDLLIKSGGVNSNLKHAEDYDIFLKLAAISKIVAVQDVCCAYRLHDSNMTWSQHALAYLEPIELLMCYSNKKEVQEALVAWRAAFALWAFRHLSFHNCKIWLPGLFSLGFLKEAYYIFWRKYRQRRSKAGRQIAWRYV